MVPANESIIKQQLMLILQIMSVWYFNSTADFCLGTKVPSLHSAGGDCGGTFHAYAQLCTMMRIDHMH